MLDPIVLDKYIDGFTARELRLMLEYDVLNATERAYITAALYYLEVNDNV